MNQRTRTLLTLSALALILPASACEKDEFANAPVARAERAGQQVNSEPVAQMQPGANTNLPANHPPVTDPGAGNVAPRVRAPSGPVKPSSYGKSGPLRWSAPEGWKAEPPANNMRMAQYAIPASQEGLEPALMTITFLPGSAGGAEANIARWVKQFKEPEKARRNTVKTPSGLTAYTVDIAGAYGGMGGNFKEDQRLLGAIIPAGGGLFFFKLTGPQAVVSGQQKAFQDFLQSLAAGG